MNYSNNKIVQNVKNFEIKLIISKNWEQIKNINFEDKFVNKILQKLQCLICERYKKISYKEENSFLVYCILRMMNNHGNNHKHITQMV